MESRKWWARKAVRQAIELGERAHSETASEECTDAFLLFARVLEKLRCGKVILTAVCAVCGRGYGAWPWSAGAMLPLWRAKP